MTWNLSSADLSISTISFKTWWGLMWYHRAWDTRQIIKVEHTANYAKRNFKVLRYVLRYMLRQPWAISITSRRKLSKLQLLRSPRVWKTYKFKKLRQKVVHWQKQYHRSSGNWNWNKRIKVVCDVMWTVVIYWQPKFTIIILST